ncbi:MAG: hypothetical protein KDH20_17210 [Rhodocyclaceae bacterium]|nr:hypothetical protein [Rhodocyclaceae bacterium]
MSAVMSHREWMKLTHGGVTSVRSRPLKAVDAALQAYERSGSPVNKQALVRALDAWKASKNGQWKTSVRNRRNAVDSLTKQLAGGAVQKDPVALSHARDESRAILTTLFQGKQLVFRSGLATKLAGNDTLSKYGVYLMPVSAARNAHTITKEVAPNSRLGGSGDGEARSMAQSLFNEVVPSDLASSVAEEVSRIMPGFMTELASSCAPFVGVGVSGAMAVRSAFKVAQNQYRLSQGQMHAQRTLSTEEPEAAMQAVVRMLSREVDEQKANLARGLADFGSKLVSVLADGGTVGNAAIGLASGLIKLLLLLRIVVRDVGEARAANQILKKPVVTAELFEACPLMGAYLVCCAPTSVIVNTILSSDKFYQPGMMDRVEWAAKRHIEPMREQAGRLIRKHRMYIPALQSFPGVLKKNEDNLKRMKKNMGKSNMVGIGSDDFA